MDRFDVERASLEMLRFFYHMIVLVAILSVTLLVNGKIRRRVKRRFQKLMLSDEELSEPIFDIQHRNNKDLKEEIFIKSASDLGRHVGEFQGLANPMEINVKDLRVENSQSESTTYYTRNQSGEASNIKISSYRSKILLPSYIGLSAKGSNDLRDYDSHDIIIRDFVKKDTYYLCKIDLNDVLTRLTVTKLRSLQSILKANPDTLFITGIEFGVSFQQSVALTIKNTADSKEKGAKGGLSVVDNASANLALRGLQNVELINQVGTSSVRNKNYYKNQDDTSERKSLSREGLVLMERLAVVDHQLTSTDTINNMIETIISGKSIGLVFPDIWDISICVNYIKSAKTKFVVKGVRKLLLELRDTSRNDNSNLLSIEEPIGNTEKRKDIKANKSLPLSSLLLNNIKLYIKRSGGSSTSIRVKSVQIRILRCSVITYELSMDMNMNVADNATVIVDASSPWVDHTKKTEYKNHFNGEPDFLGSTLRGSNLVLVDDKPKSLLENVKRNVDNISKVVGKFVTEPE